MSADDNVNIGFVVEMVQGDAFDYEADVLAVKDAARSGGLDAQIRVRLRDSGQLPDSKPYLAIGDYQLWSGEGITHAPQILMVGAPTTHQLGYAQLRDLGRHFLEALWQDGATVGHLAMTVHGVKTRLGLDEVEAFRSLLLGISDAYESGHYPPTLRRITFVERDQHRADVLGEALRRFLPTPSPEDESPPPATTERARGQLKQVSAVPVDSAQMMAGAESFEPAYAGPEADDATPHIFVAMPFADDYDDQFYLALQPCVREAGFLCERMDLDTFTGDIMQRMFERITSARLMIALLDGANPNVYLEIGYAWCAETPTILVAHADQMLPFDVRSHRVLIYDKIYQLKEMLTRELRRLVEE
ncbi:MAG: hypothetical protein GYB65_10415 [Chloroflexi bacterium]|nr:hypothetical protein [Chloroflexota bacterium]